MASSILCGSSLGTYNLNRLRVFSDVLSMIMSNLVMSEHGEILHADLIALIYPGTNIVSSPNVLIGGFFL